MSDKEKKPGIFYHGSYVKGLKTLQPYSKSHNTIKKPVIYLTPNETLSLFYIWKLIYKFVTFSEDENGIVIYKEWYNNQFEDFYEGLSGSVYECKDGPCIYGTHIAGVYNCDVPLDVSRETVIDDVCKEIKKRINDGSVILQTYSSLSPEDKEKIEKDVVRSIHMQRLLNPGGSEYSTASAAFYREHFPVLWRRAEKMSEDEIKAMYDEWKKSVGI